MGEINFRPIEPTSKIYISTEVNDFTPTKLISVNSDYTVVTNYVHPGIIIVTTESSAKSHSVSNIIDAIP